MGRMLLINTSIEILNPDSFFAIAHAACYDLRIHLLTGGGQKNKFLNTANQFSKRF